MARGNIPDEPTLSERGAYDAYLNVLNLIKSKMEKEQIIGNELKDKK